MKSKPIAFACALSLVIPFYVENSVEARQAKGCNVICDHLLPPAPKGKGVIQFGGDPRKTLVETIHRDFGDDLYRLCMYRNSYAAYAITSGVPREVIVYPGQCVDFAVGTLSVSYECGEPDDVCNARRGKVTTCRVCDRIEYSKHWWYRGWFVHYNDYPEIQKQPGNWSLNDAAKHTVYTNKTYILYGNAHHSYRVCGKAKAIVVDGENKGSLDNTCADVGGKIISLEGPDGGGTYEFLQ